MRLLTRANCGPGPTGKRRFQAAFTFAEVLAALVFMAIVIPVAMQGLQLSSRAGVVAERKSMAVQLADRLLNEQVISGNWTQAGQRGVLRMNGIDFEWRILNEIWRETGLRLISVEIKYLAQNHPYWVNVSTLVKETS